MPVTEHDNDLKEFLEKHHFKRSQVRTKFNQLVKLTDATSSTTNRVDIEECPVYISLLQRVPRTIDMIAVLKKAPVYRALTTHHNFDETLLQKLEGEAMWEGFTEKSLKALANILNLMGGKGMNYNKLLSRKHSEKEDGLKNDFVILHSGDDFHFITFLSLLATVFTREFYVQLNKWTNSSSRFLKLLLLPQGFQSMK